MSTKELAYSIIDRLSEEQLQGFIAMFSEPLPIAVDQDKQYREDAFAKMQKLRRNIPDLDEKRELAEYRNQRYVAI